jgi:hypothetical protein
LKAKVSGVKDGHVVFVYGGKGNPPKRLSVPIDGRGEITADLRRTPGIRWIRADVRSAEQRLLLVGNPVHLQN